MSAGVAIGIGVAIIAAFLAFRLWQNHRAQASITASTCGDTAFPGGTVDPAAWYIGPPLSEALGGTKSPGQPLHPAQEAPGFSVTPPIGALPRALGVGDKLDSLAFKHGPLTGKTQIEMDYRVDLAPGAELLAVPEVDPANHFPARMTVYFQREGDDWSGAGAFEAYRWYYTEVDVYLAAGDHALTLPLTKGWTAVETSTMDNNRAGFDAAIANTCCLGFGFGGNENGRIHGMFATGVAKITVTKFAVLP